MVYYILPGFQLWLGACVAVPVVGGMKARMQMRVSMMVGTEAGWR